jgi:pteridine reductase
MELKGKVALVTGAGQRLGRLIALGMAQQGCSVMVHFHRSAGLARATADEAAGMGVEAAVAQADLNRHDGILELFEQVDARFQHLDFLVNSAAIMQAVDMLEASEDDWRRTIDLNLKGPFFCLQQAAIRMKAGGGGAIVNLSDLAGARPWRRFPIHSISKAGIEMLTRVAALALAPDVRVNAIAPGPVLKPDSLSTARWEQIGSRLPLGRAGRAEDVVAGIVFLLSNDYINGVTLHIDGGGYVQRRGEP